MKGCPTFKYTNKKNYVLGHFELCERVCMYTYLCDMKNITHLLQRIGVDAVCSVTGIPSGLRNVTRKTSLAFVLFFFLAFALAGPMRFSTSAFRNFSIPTQSILK